MRKELRHVLTLSRPRFWLYLAGPALLGLIYGSGSIEALLTVENLALFLFFLVPANVFLYGVNDIFDRRIDRQNPKKDEKEAKFADAPRVTLVATAVSGLLAVAVAPFLGGPALLAFIAFLGLSVGYSASPVRFKARPILDSVSNGLYILPGVVTYGVMTGSIPPIPVLAAGWLWTMAMHTFSAVPDIGPDREAGIATTATMLGHRPTLLYCTLVWAGSTVAAGMVSLRFGLLMAVYPVLSAVYWYRDMAVDGIYWYYPYINGIVGMVISLGGLLALA